MAGIQEGYSREVMGNGRDTIGKQWGWGRDTTGMQ